MTDDKNWPASKSGRFDFVKYDQHALVEQQTFKYMFEKIEDSANAFLPEGRPKSIFMTKLEEAYMWAGKAIRDKQIERNAATELQEERKDS